MRRSASVIAGLGFLFLGSGCFVSVPPPDDVSEHETDSGSPNRSDGGTLDASQPVEHGACWGAREACEPFGRGRMEGVEERAGSISVVSAPDESVPPNVLWMPGIQRVQRIDTSVLGIDAVFWPAIDDLYLDVWGTAVDTRTGDLIVSTVADYFGVAYLARFAADPATCPDENGNGTIDTSDGPRDPVEEDECILWVTQLDALGDHRLGVQIQRSAAAGGAQVALGWVHAGDRFVQFDAETGVLTGVTVPPFGSAEWNGDFDIAMDDVGWLWSTEGRFDTASPEDTAAELPSNEMARYDVAIDEAGSPWFTGCGAGPCAVMRFNREDESWDVVPLDGYPGTLAADLQGSVWVALETEDDAAQTEVVRVRTDSLQTSTLEVDATGGISILALDVEHRLWALGRDVSLIDPDDDSVRSVSLDDSFGRAWLSVGELSPVGLPSRPAGTWSAVTPGCASGPTTWRRAEVEAAVPGNGIVTMWARSGADLARAAWIRLGTASDGSSAFDLAAVGTGPQLELRADLAGQSSLLREASVSWQCAE